MTYTKYSKTISSLLLTSLTIGLISCSSGGGDSGSATATDDAVTTDAATALTQGISFAGGTVVTGTPPTPTNNPGDPSITNPPLLEAPKWNPGKVGALDIQIQDIPANTTNFNVNIQFGQSTNSFIQIPINDPSLLSSIASSGGAGTLSLPFSVPPSVCDNIADIQHQITCYESVDLGGGNVVSKEVAQQMILACDDTTASLPNSCGDNVLQQDCASLDNQTGVIANYVSGATCASSYPNLTYDSSILDPSCSSYTQGTSLPDLYDDTSFIFNGDCGACAYDITDAASSLSFAKKAGGTDGQDAAAILNAAIQDQLMEYATDSALARKKITFTPNK